MKSCCEIAEAAVSILLLIDPAAFISGIFIAAGVVLLVMGGFSIIKYFLTNSHEAATGQRLTSGLFALVSYAFCALHHQRFVATFPLLTIVYGVVALVARLGKIR